MTKEEIIAGLLDNAKDRRALISPDDEDSIFEHDALVMEAAVELIVKQNREISELRRAAISKKRLWPFGYKGRRLKGG